MGRPVTISYGRLGTLQPGSLLVGLFCPVARRGVLFCPVASPPRPHASYYPHWESNRGSQALNLDILTTRAKPHVVGGVTLPGHWPSHSAWSGFESLCRPHGCHAIAQSCSGSRFNPRSGLSPRITSAGAPRVWFGRSLEPIIRPWVYALPLLQGALDVPSH